MRATDNYDPFTPPVERSAFRRRLNNWRVARPTYKPSPRADAAATAVGKVIGAIIFLGAFATLLYELSRVVIVSR